MGFTLVQNVSGSAAVTAVDSFNIVFPSPVTKGNLIFFFVVGIHLQVLVPIATDTLLNSYVRGEGLPSQTGPDVVGCQSEFAISIASGANTIDVSIETDGSNDTLQWQAFEFSGVTAQSSGSFPPADDSEGNNILDGLTLNMFPSVAGDLFILFGTSSGTIGLPLGTTPTPATPPQTPNIISGFTTAGLTPAFLFTAGGGDLTQLFGSAFLAGAAAPVGLNLAVLQDDVVIPAGMQLVAFYLPQNGAPADITLQMAMAYIQRDNNPDCQGG